MWLIHICSKALGRKGRLKEASRLRGIFQEQKTCNWKKGLKILSIYLCIFFVLRSKSIFYKRRKNSLILDVILLDFLIPFQ
jgi:hypothetical protein